MSKLSVDKAKMYTANVLIRNLESAYERLEFGEFSITRVGPKNLEAARAALASTEIYVDDWWLTKKYAEVPPGPDHSPAGVGGIPGDMEDLLLLLRLYKVGDISFTRQSITANEGRPKVQSPYRVINDSNSDSVFRTELNEEDCSRFIEFATGLRASLSWKSSWFTIAKRYFLYGKAKELSPKWDEVDRLIDYATTLEATLVCEIDFSRRRSSRRGARLVASDDPKKYALVESTIRRVYDIRSRLVHGSGLGEKDRTWLLENAYQVEYVVIDVLVTAIQKIGPTDESRRKTLTELFDVEDCDRADFAFQKFAEIKTDECRQSALDRMRTSRGLGK